jgi:uncharacterized NAD-dependent epimerase/dehydratase family protein
MSTEADSQDYIFLGGQISAKHPIFKDIAQLGSYAPAHLLLRRFKDPEWKKLPAHEKILDIIFTLGQVEFMQNSGELTKLSAVLGDTRQKFNQAVLRDDLNKRLYASESP